MSTRGTVDFNFKGKEVTLRPDFESLEEIEEELNESMMMMAMNIAKGLKFKQIAVIIWAGLRGHYRNDISKAPSLNEVKTWLYEDMGALNQEIAMKVGEFIRNSVATPDELEISEQVGKNKKKATKKK